MTPSLSCLGTKRWRGMTWPTKTNTKKITKTYTKSTLWLSHQLMMTPSSSDSEQKDERARLDQPKDKDKDKPKDKYKDNDHIPSTHDNPISCLGTKRWRGMTWPTKIERQIQRSIQKTKTKTISHRLMMTLSSHALSCNCQNSFKNFRLLKLHLLPWNKKMRSQRCQKLKWLNSLDFSSMSNCFKQIFQIWMGDIMLTYRALEVILIDGLDVSLNTA